MTRLGGHVTIFSQVSRADALRVQSQLDPWSMEVPQGQFVPFSCGSNRGIANHKYAVRRALLKPITITIVGQVLLKRSAIH